MTEQKDPNDKYAKFKVPYGTNEHHEEDEWDPTTEGKIADWHTRHQDKLLDKFCDNHPGAPQCKVFDD